MMSVLYFRADGKIVINEVSEKSSIYSIVD